MDKGKPAAAVQQERELFKKELTAWQATQFSKLLPGRWTSDHKSGRLYHFIMDFSISPSPLAKLGPYLRPNVFSGETLKGSAVFQPRPLLENDPNCLALKVAYYKNSYNPFDSDADTTQMTVRACMNFDKPGRVTFIESSSGQDTPNVELVILATDFWQLQI